MGKDVLDHAQIQALSIAVGEPELPLEAEVPPDEGGLVVALEGASLPFA